MISEIKMLFSKISQMKEQRVDDYKQLRDQIQADDITKKIVTRMSDDTNVSNVS